MSLRSEFEELEHFINTGGLDTAIEKAEEDDFEAMLRMVAACYEHDESVDREAVETVYDALERVFRYHTGKMAHLFERGRVGKIRANKVSMKDKPF